MRVEMRTFSRLIVILAGACLGSALAGAQEPPSSSAILDQAKSQAAGGKRAIFAIFHASW
jgi:hypothetical protein